MYNVISRSKTTRNLVVLSLPKCEESLRSLPSVGTRISPVGRNDKFEIPPLVHISCFEKMYDSLIQGRDSNQQIGYARASEAGPTGRKIDTVVPFSGSLVTLISPSWASIIL